MPPYLSFFSFGCSKKGFKALQSYEFDMRDTIIHLNSAESFQYTFEEGFSIQLDTNTLVRDEYFIYTVKNYSKKPLWVNTQFWQNERADTSIMYPVPLWHLESAPYFRRIAPGKTHYGGFQFSKNIQSFSLTLCFIENYQTLLKEAKVDDKQIDYFNFEKGWEVFIPQTTAPGKGLFFISIENFVPTDTSAQVTVRVSSN